VSLDPQRTGPIEVVAPTTVRSVGVGRWRAATFALFLVNGLTMGTWASRIPAVATELGLGVAQLGVLITTIPAGALLGLLLSSHVLHRLGERRTAIATQSLLAAAISVFGLSAVLTGNLVVAGVTLIAYGIGMSTSNIVINLEAAALDRQTGRTLMSVFHATWSVGAFLGAGLGAVAIAARLPVSVHFPVIAAVALATSLVAIRFLPELGDAQSETEPIRFGERMRVWVEPRTLLIGLIVLAAQFNEGTANNWLNISLVHGRGWDAAVGAAALTVFAASMVAGRVAGGWYVDRVGRVSALRTAFALAGTGLLLIVFIDAQPVAFLGVALWGLGASLGYPLGVSAAADEPRNAPARVAAVATVATIAGLVGPSVIGLLGESVGLPQALLVVAVLVVVGLLVSGAARPPRKAA